MKLFHYVNSMENDTFVSEINNHLLNKSLISYC